MGKAFFCLVVIAVGIAMSSPALPDTRRDGDRPVLNVLNWSWYIELDHDADEALPIEDRSPVLVQFEQEFHCDVRYLEMDAESAMREASDYPHLRYVAPNAALRAKTVYLRRANGEALTELWERIMDSGD